PPPIPPLFPYTTLFRSRHTLLHVAAIAACLGELAIIDDVHAKVDLSVDDFFDAPGQTLVVLSGIRAFAVFAILDQFVEVARPRQDRKSTRLNSITWPSR